MSAVGRTLRREGRCRRWGAIRGDARKRVEPKHDSSNSCPVRTHPGVCRRQTPGGKGERAVAMRKTRHVGVNTHEERDMRLMQVTPDTRGIRDRLCQAALQTWHCNCQYGAGKSSGQHFGRAQEWQHLPGEQQANSTHPPTHSASHYSKSARTSCLAKASQDGNRQF